MTGPQNSFAIIGMACRFPKAPSVATFWELLCQGKDGLSKVDEDTVSHYVPVKGVVENIESFDASFFGISPADAQLLDPQIRIFLESAHEALEDSGNVADKFAGKIGVFSGMADSQYLQQNILKNLKAQSESDWFQKRVATSMGCLSTYVSYYLNVSPRESPPYMG